jgi:hypothetical protein
MIKLNENAIKEAAYFIWQNSGCPSGQDEQIWWMAVEQLNGCTSSKSCASKVVNTKTAAVKKKVAPKKAAE